MGKRGLPPDMKKKSLARPDKAAVRRSRAAKKAAGLLKVGGVILAVGLMGYCINETSGVAYGEDDLLVVDFSSLSDSEKRTALREANAARCTCGCGMTLAQCVSTDMTCPVRAPNIERIKDIVQKANRP